MSEFVDHIRSSILEDATLHTPYTYHGDGHTRSKTERDPERRLTGGGHPCTTTVKATWPICIALHTTSESRMFSLKLFAKTKKNTYARRTAAQRVCRAGLQQEHVPRRRSPYMLASPRRRRVGQLMHPCATRCPADVAWDAAAAVPSLGSPELRLLVS